MTSQVDGKWLSYSCCSFLFDFFFQVMTWVWPLRSLNTWGISPSLPPVCSRYQLTKVENKPASAAFPSYKLPVCLCVWQNAELKFNFGGEDFKHAPKGGFVALDQAPEGHQVKSSQTGVWMQTPVRCSKTMYWKETEKINCVCEIIVEPEMIRYLD